MTATSRRSLAHLALALSMSLVACQSNNTAHISGQLVPGQSAALTLSGESAAPAPSRKITHVMAVDPESARPNRVLAPVEKDGHFALDVNFGHPYVLVFIDSTAVGADMVVATFRANTLDTLAPRNEGDVDLGKVSTSGTSAVSGQPYEKLLQQLGLSASAAEYLGSIDDLSLRYANPDIDGDGVIDIQQDGHQFQLDFHLRAQMFAGATGNHLRMSDLTDQFLPESGDLAASPNFNLGSIYALYPATFDGTDYVAMGMASGGHLQNGAAFRAFDSDGADASSSSSYSGLGFGDERGWGPDYNWAQAPAPELPGSGGKPATLAFTLGSGRTLTFSNVVTRTHASLSSFGTLVPFVRLDTAGGLITGLSYKWMKRVSSSEWTMATQEEMDLVVGDQGGYTTFYRGAKSNPIGFVLPRQPSGSIPWAVSSTAEMRVSAADMANTRPDDLCSMAVSYDDKLGLRLFVGAVDPNDGVVPCP